MSLSKLKVVFFGTAEFAVPSLERLHGAGHEILMVVSQPDKPQGRGRHLTSPPVKLAADRLGLPILQPRRVRSESLLEKMRSLAPDALALAAFGQIVPQALLDLPPLGPINVHGSLLPKYRGAAPIQRCLMAGELVTGVTTMWMDATLDTGDILLSSSLEISPDDNVGTLTPKLAEIGADLLIETLQGLAEGTISRQPQDSSLATHAPALLPEDGTIRWEESASAICNRIRGVTPKPGATAYFRGKRVKIIDAHLDALVSSELAPGEIINPKLAIVAAGGGSSVRLVTVQPEGKRAMLAGEWIRGNRIMPGERFDSPDQSQVPQG